jgi:hypothetical protein
MIGTILLVFAFVLAALAAYFSAPAPDNGWGSRLGWASLACFYLSLILGGLGNFNLHR